jgi:hypothetical protein
LAPGTANGHVTAWESPLLGRPADSRFLFSAQGKAMRKLFWCGTALTVAAAILVFLAARSTGQPASSLMSAATSLAWRAGTDANPLFRLGQVLMTAATGNRQVSEEEPGGIDEECVCAPEEPQLVTEPPPPSTLPATTTVQRCEPIDLLATAATADAHPAVPDPVEEQGFRSAVAGRSMTGWETSYKFMPPCLDDEAELPAVMPYAKEAEILLPAAAQVTLTEKSLTEQGFTKFAAVTFVLDLLEQLERLQDSTHCPASQACARPCPKCPGCCTAPVENKGYYEEQEQGSNVQPQRGSQLRTSETQKAQNARFLRRLEGPEEMLPKIDTLEFRPSDARKGEFDRIPF